MNRCCKTLVRMGKIKPFLFGMAVMLCLCVLLTGVNSKAGVSDNAGSRFVKLAHIFGVGKEASVPNNKSGFDSATMMEKINYLEKEVSQLQKQMDSVALGGGGNALNIKTLQEESTYNDNKAREIYIKGPCIVYGATHFLSTGIDYGNDSCSCDFKIEVDGKVFNSWTHSVSREGNTYGFKYEPARVGADYRDMAEYLPVPLRVVNYIRVSMSSVRGSFFGNGRSILWVKYEPLAGQ